MGIKILSIVKNKVGDTTGYDILNLEDGKEYKNVKIGSLMGKDLVNGQIIGKATPYIRGNKKLPVRTENSKIILYHGSNHEIRNPVYQGGYKLNDYGPGFYATTIKEKAEEWALLKSGDSIVNTYELDINGLKVCNLDDYGPLAWIAEVLKNRGLKDEDKEYIKIMNEFIGKYRINTNNYDIIYGYRADDSYFMIIRAFLHNMLTADEVVQYFYRGKLGKQVFLKSQRAFKNIIFSRSSKVSNARLQYAKNSDKEARASVEKVLRRREVELMRNVNLYTRDMIIGDCLRKHYIWDTDRRNYYEK